MKKLYFLLCFFYTFMSMSLAQYYGGSKKNWNIGLYAGINNYFGDVSNAKNKLLISDPFTKDFYQNRNVMFQLSMGKKILPYWNLRLNILYGNIQNESNDLDLKFISYYTHEFSLLNSIDALALTDVYDWHLNIHAGLGLYAFRTTLLNTETNTVLQDKPNTFTRSFCIPFGIGFAYDINDDWKFTFDLMYRWVASDQLDAYASEYKKFEGFSYAAIGIQYAFTLPSFQQRNVRKSFPLSKNYGFAAMGTDRTHKLYKQRKRRGNLTPINNSTKYKRKTYRNVNSRQYRIKSRKIK